MGERIDPRGAGVFCQSHPYENVMWSTPGALLTAGELEVSDELTELCLNYLTGVTSAHGPDEGWNEGYAYATDKAWTMVKATMYAAELLPELEIQKNPFYEKLAQWFAHFVPIGIQRLPFGDKSFRVNKPIGRRSNANMTRALAWLTGNGRWTHRMRQIPTDPDTAMPGKAWIELLFSRRFETPGAVANERKSAVFPEAGWIMVNSHGPSTASHWENSVGMIFQCRSRGAFSHSFRAENDFAWHAYGQTLSAGGGGMDFPDPHSRHSMSHNVILVNGREQGWDAWWPKQTYVGRILAYEKGNGYVFWVGDATKAYPKQVGLRRWHRYIVFVDDCWFVIYDDLEMKPDAGPARFSWLFNIFPQPPLEILQGQSSFRFQMGEVTGFVDFADETDSLEIVDMQGREAYKNLITGEDMYDKTIQALARRKKKLIDLTAHCVWTTNKTPRLRQAFLASLTASKGDMKAPAVNFGGKSFVRVEFPNGTARSVSFDPKVKADIVIDPEIIRAHACMGDCGLPSVSDKCEEIVIGGDTYSVQWIGREAFDNAWLSRWAVEGSSQVHVEDGTLWVRRQPGVHSPATIWYREELPGNVFVRFRAKPIPPEGDNACNLNLFVHARELDGTPLRFGRCGAYKDYHLIPNYIVTFVGGYMPGWSRMRRDPGFKMVSESDIRSEVDKEYEIVLTIQDGRLRYYVNGERIHDYTDPDPLPGGRFGIRSWSTNACWNEIQFGVFPR